MIKLGDEELIKYAKSVVDNLSRIRIPQLEKELVELKARRVAIINSLKEKEQPSK